MENREPELVGRQGDVLIWRIHDVPEDVKFDKKGKPVLAYGELTGHKHQIVEEVNYTQVTGFSDGIEGLLEIKESTRLRHGTDLQEKHGTIELSEGIYGWSIQQEFHAGKRRRVQD